MYNSTADSSAPVAPARSLFAETALLPDGWARSVVIDIDRAGMIAAVRRDAPAGGVEIASGPVVPAMPNLHSHAFQRAMAGLAEHASAGPDTFWTWREAMYHTVGLLTPRDIEAVAAKLYIDMLKGGYGAVAEFHYVHNDADGVPYADPAELSRRILAAAGTAGIGMTLLPTFYAHANFGGVAATLGQRRFLHDTASFLSLYESLGPVCAAADATLGLAFHSLRAATDPEMRAILDALAPRGPIHIHAAEQQREIDDSLAFSGARPVEWLLDHMPIDPRWCLIHATHMDKRETGRLARSGAVVGLCPTTEGNLGDGIFDGVAFQAAGGRFGIGGDSHVSTSIAEELRQLEYSQRLRDQRRNCLVTGPHRSVGGDLYQATLAGGAQALGQPIGAIAPGKAASLVVLDANDPFIAFATGDVILDRWLFALGDRAVKDVMVAGQWRIRERRHAQDEAVDRAFRHAIGRLVHG